MWGKLCLIVCCLSIPVLAIVLVANSKLFSARRTHRPDTYVAPVKMDESIAPDRSMDEGEFTWKLANGDRAPAFQLEKVEGEGKVGLTDLVDDRPVVLVFGSFT